MNACKDCRWSRDYWFKPMKCLHLLARRPEETDPVTGAEEPPGYWACAVMRMRINERCGYEGKLWEKRA
jgi:hypothetical protein